MRKRSQAMWLAMFLLLNWIVYVASAAELKIEKTLTQADGLVSNTVLTVFEDSHGTMWFGTTDGLTRYDGENFQNLYKQKMDFHGTTIGLIFEDRRGMLWFGDGVLSSFLERGKPMDMSWMETPLSELDLTPYDAPKGMRRSIPSGGVSRYDGEKFRIFTTTDGLPRDNC